MSVFAIFTSYPYFWCMLAVYMICSYLYIRFYQTSKLELYFKKGSVMAKIIENSKLTTQVYVPYFLAWSVHL
jgi:hypothetical protein